VIEPPLIFFTFSAKAIDIYARIWYNNIRKEVRTLSKKKQKKSGNKKDQPASKINLVTAIVNLVIAILLLIEKLTR
jgi:hypothetical protein